MKLVDIMYFEEVFVTLGLILKHLLLTQTIYSSHLQYIGNTMKLCKILTDIETNYVMKRYQLISDHQKATSKNIREMGQTF